MSRACGFFFGGAFVVSACVVSAKPTATPTPRPSLVDIARASRRTGPAPDPKRTPIVITDETVEAQRRPSGRAADRATPTPPPTRAELEAGKRARWRQIFTANQDRIRTLTGTIETIETQIPKLLADYYADDDLEVRDTVKRAHLDELLDELSEARHGLKAAREESAAILKAARADGSVAGWFRDLK